MQSRHPVQSNRHDRTTIHNLYDYEQKPSQPQPPNQHHQFNQQQSMSPHPSQQHHAYNTSNTPTSHRHVNHNNNNNNNYYQQQSPLTHNINNYNNNINNINNMNSMNINTLNINNMTHSSSKNNSNSNSSSNNNNQYQSNKLQSLQQQRRVSSQPSNIHQQQQQHQQQYQQQQHHSSHNNHSIRQAQQINKISSAPPTNNNNNSNTSGTSGTSGVGTRRVNDDALFNLQGILRIMNNNNDPNYQMVTLGMDLTQLGGLDLNCPEPEIHHTFLSPWLDKWDDSTKYSTPQSYKLKKTNNDQPYIKFINKYKLTTLFYIFYSNVNDKMQIAASKELYKRDWVYHKGLKLWLNQIKINKKDNDNNKKTVNNKKDKDIKNKNDKNQNQNVDKNNDKKDDNNNILDNNNIIKNINEDAAITFMKRVHVDDIEYFDVQSWKTRHFHQNFPVNWNKERKKLLYEHELNYFYKACQDPYNKNRHGH